MTAFSACIYYITGMSHWNNAPSYRYKFMSNINPGEIYNKFSFSMVGVAIKLWLATVHSHAQAQSSGPYKIALFSLFSVVE